jgi:metal-responsive CopG/Arc/MetJ family transcriptional regulator
VFAAEAPDARAAPKLRGKRQTITFGLPPDLVAEIDAIAVEESRSRARMIEIGMRQFVRDYRRREAA